MRSKWKTPKNNDERYKVIKECMKQVQKSGVNITDGSWGIDLNKADDGSVCFKKFSETCALGALIISVEEDPTFHERVAALNYINTKVAAAYLGVSSKWVTDFVMGFDDYYYDEWLDSAAYKMGQKLRKEFKLNDD